MPTPPVGDSAFWRQVWRILQEECSAGEDRYGFVERAGSFPREWRFQGALGFGGKLWHHNGRLTVSCYREDETPARLQMMARANARLATLLAARDGLDAEINPSCPEGTPA